MSGLVFSMVEKKLIINNELKLIKPFVVFWVKRHDVLKLQRLFDISLILVYDFHGNVKSYKIATRAL
jgi:hypothetical protein